MAGKIYPPEAASAKDVTKLKIWDVAVIESDLLKKYVLKLLHLNVKLSSRVEQEMY